MTNREALEAMREIEANADYVENIDKMLASLDKKAETAKRYKEKKNGAMAEEKEIVKAVITNDPKTVADVLAEVEDKIEGVTRNKVVARLTSLIKAGEVEKGDVKTEDGKVVKAYALPGSFEAAEA